MKNNARPNGKSRRGLLVAGVVLLLILVAGWFAGPYLALRGLKAAVDRGDLTALDRYIDFPAVRRNLRPQIEDRIARGMIGRFGSGVATQAANMIAGSAVDAMASPAGLGILLQGDALVKQVKGDTVGDGLVKESRKPDPFGTARVGFESPMRFNAIVPTDAGEVAFVFQPRGWRWKITEILLPKPASADNSQ